MWRNRSAAFLFSLYGVLFGLAFGVFSTLAELSTQGMPLTLESILDVQRSTPLLWLIDTAPVLLGLFGGIAGRRQNESIRLSDTMSQRIQERDQAIGQLETLRASLGERVDGYTRQLEAATAELAARSAELENARQHQLRINRQLEEAVHKSQRRAALLKASADISRTVAQIRDVDGLLCQVTQLIGQHFGIYHTGIFLIDNANRYAVLHAANSEGGQRMLARQYKLGVGSEGIVGYVTGTGQPRLATDIDDDSDFFDNPDLPDTRSEMAVPLRVGKEIIGALDVQSTEQAAFDDEDAAVLIALADQIAIAIENSRLFQQSQAALEEARRTQRRFVQQQWSQLTQEQSTLAHEFALAGAPPTLNSALPEAEQSWRERRLVIMDGDHSDTKIEAGRNGTSTRAALAAPIKVRDEIIGILDVQQTEDEHTWSEDEIALVQAVADQLGQALEEARLFEQTQASLAETQTLFHTSRSLAAAQQMDDIWQAVTDAARERHADACGLFLFDTHERETARELVLVAGWDEKQPSQLKGGARLTLDSLGILDILEPESSLSTADLAHASNIDKHTRDLVTGLGYSAALFQPIAARGRWFGLLTVLYQSPHTFASAETDFYRSLVDQAALAFEGQRLLAEAQRRAERERLIRHISDKVRATSDLETILQTTVQELSKALELPRAFVRLGTEKELVAIPPAGNPSSHDTLQVAETIENG
jgi:GAF domain-containing protein